jgi:multicomponent Na+:H+ antiporter subunit B
MKTPYSESPVITTTVRVVAPFALTYGIFVTLHGADSPGGGFQGGVIAASVFVMIAFAFGIGPTRDWVDERVLLALFVSGVVGFAGVTLAAVFLGGSALELGVFPVAIKWSIEAIEVAIGAIVTGVVTGLFFLLGQERGGEKE